MPFFHFERQFFSVLLGCTFGAALLVVPISMWKRFAPWLLVASFALLRPRADPGHRPRGQRQPALDPASGR